MKFRDTATKCRAACKKDGECNFFTFLNYHGQVATAVQCEALYRMYTTFHFGGVFYFTAATSQHCT